MTFKKLLLALRKRWRGEPEINLKRIMKRAEKERLEREANGEYGAVSLAEGIAPGFFIGSEKKMIVRRKK